MFKKRMFAHLGLLAALTFTTAQATENRPPNSNAPNCGDFHSALALLSNPDPAQRDAGRQTLMGMSIADVDMLRDAMGKGHPTPAQAEALEDIVTYVVTRSKINPTAGSGQAFLGIVFSNDGFDEVDPAENPPRGVPVRPIPGFVAYRYLQDGDVVMGFGTGKNIQPTESAEDFREAVSRYSAGEPMTLQVQRGAKLIEVTMTPDRRPDDAQDVITMQQRIAKAQADAVHDWAEKFEPLLASAE